jgi:kynureninase
LRAAAVGLVGAYARQFAMETQLRTAVPASQRYLCGTQPITSLAMVECGLDICRTDRHGSSLRGKSLALHRRCSWTWLAQECAGFHGLTLITPRGHADDAAAM